RCAARFGRRAPAGTAVAPAAAARGPRRPRPSLRSPADDDRARGGLLDLVGVEEHLAPVLLGEAPRRLHVRRVVTVRGVAVGEHHLRPWAVVRELEGEQERGAVVDAVAGGPGVALDGRERGAG